MTLAEASQRIGTTVSTLMQGAQGTRAYLHWTVADYKSAYGRDRWLLTPVSGSGEMWFETNSIHW